MAFRVCCSCREFDYVNVKAFTASSGVWAWEKKALAVMCSPNNTVRILRQRETSGWTNSDTANFATDGGLGVLTLRPSATVNTVWTTNTAANIDDAISPPSGTGDGSICQAVGPTDHNDEQQWAVSGSYTAGTNVIKAVSIWMLAKKTLTTNFQLRPVDSIVAEVVTQPTAGNGTFTTFSTTLGSDTIVNTWEMDTATTTAAPVKITVWIYCRFDSNTDGTISGIRLRSNGTFYSRTLTGLPAGGSWGWCYAEFTETFTNASTADYAVELTMPLATVDGVVDIDTIYFDVEMPTTAAGISAVKFRSNGTWYTAATAPTLTTSYAWHRVDIEATSSWTLSTSSPAVALKADVPNAGTSIEVEAVLVSALATNSPFTYPSGTTPASNYKQYAVDSVIVANDGTETAGATDCELFEVLWDRTSSSAWVRRGLPLSPPARMIYSTDNRCSNGGVVVDSVVPQLQTFDLWKRATVKKYRICPGWNDNTGSPLQIVFRRFASSATLTHEDDAATIDTALTALDGVVSVTVTGGPLFVKNVDIEITWAAATDQFHSVHGVNFSTSSNQAAAVVDIDDYQVTGYWENASRPPYWTSSGTDALQTVDQIISSVNWYTLRRYAPTTDADGWTVYTSLVWNSKITTAAIGGTLSGGNMVSHARNGVIIGAHSRRNFSSSVNKYNYFVLDETDGSGLPDGEPTDQYINGTGDTGHSTIDKAYIADNDKHIVYGLQDSAALLTNELWEMPATPNQLNPDRLILLGKPPVKSDNDYVWSTGNLYGSTPALNATVLDIRYGGETTFKASGDANFAAHAYNARTVIFLGNRTRYRGNTMEWRFVLGSVVSGNWSTGYSSDWLPTTADDADANTALFDMWGNTSDATQAIKVVFNAAAVDDQELSWFYRGGTVLICMARSGNTTDTTVDNLVPFGLTLRIEVRNANTERFLTIAKENFNDGVVQWQRNAGVAALTATVTPSTVLDNGSQLLAISGWWRPLTIDEDTGLPTDDVTIYGELP